MKWIQNHSDYFPPMYLTESRYNAAQAQDLKSHGINTRALNDITDNETENSRFDKLSDRSKQVELFLEDIKIGRFKSEYQLTSREVAEVIYDKIKHLESLNFILLDQIRTAFTYCNFLPVMEFHNTSNIIDSHSFTITGKWITRLRLVS